MAWDATPILEGEPDQLGELYVQVLVDPNRPLPLAMIECAADLDISIKVMRPDTGTAYSSPGDSASPNASPDSPRFPGLVSYVLCFSGRCLDLSEFDMRLGAWQARHNLPNKSEQDLHLERIAARIRH